MGHTQSAIPAGTDTYIHHIPGRLRVRSALVKRNEQRANAAAAWLGSLPGVSSVRANTVTGSLTVQYDCAQTDVHAILSPLREQGWIGAQTQVPAFSVPDRNGLSGSDLGVQIARSVALFTLEKAAELSVRALVSAIL